MFDILGGGGGGAETINGKNCTCSVRKRLSRLYMKMFKSKMEEMTVCGLFALDSATLGQGHIKGAI